MQQLTVGLAIADDMEFAALKEGLRYPFMAYDYLGREGLSFELTDNDKSVRVVAVHCGIGKVNAATAATYLAEHGAKVLLNYGLSGGVFGVNRGDIVIGTSFMEHDFDLTCLGYGFGEKPGQLYIYKADAALVGLFATCGAHICKGAMATGDRFVSDNVLRDKLHCEMGIACCDMETAAIASVAALYRLPFCAVRKVSDDAGTSADEAYRQMNNQKQENLLDVLFKGLEGLCGLPALWQTVSNQ